MPPTCIYTLRSVRARKAISDNGCGFSVEKGLQAKGKGLNNQLRRAASIGTTAAWHSDQYGTRMTLTLPTVQKRSTEAN
jgi:signal transduction histidine kinase